MTEKFFLLVVVFFLFLYGGYSLAPDLAAKKNERGVGGGVPCCSEVRLGLPGFSEPCPICEAPAKSLPSLNNLVGGVPLSLPPSVPSPLPPSLSLSHSHRAFPPLSPILSPSPSLSSPLLPIHQQRAVTLPSKTPDSGRTKDHYSMV